MTTREVSGNSFGNDAKVILGDITIVNTDDSNAENIFLQEISKTNPMDDKKQILATKGPFIYNSFCWILEHDDFKTWRDTKNSGVFWIKGDPGKGKTMLLCGIIEEFEKNSDTQEKFAYFFCQGADVRLNTATAVVKGLIYSVLRQNQRLLSHIRKQVEKEPKGQLEGPNAWFALSRIFTTIFQDPCMTDFICIIDALDECQHQESRKLLLNLIVDTSNHIKWLVSSRNEKEIERGLRSIESHQRLVLELKSNAGHISKAVDIYIDRCVRDIEALEDDADLRIKTVNSLKAKANGTFLWVTLVVQQLRDTGRPHIESVLNRMPEDLKSLYNEIMERSKRRWGKDEEACLILLATVTAAERPLHIGELYIFTSSQLIDSEIRYHPDDIKYLAKACGSFISISNDTIYFIHQSVKDYMVHNGAISIFPDSIGHQHSRMFEISLDAMDKTLGRNIYNIGPPGKHIDEITPPDPNPLASKEYCCAFWVEHLIRCCQSQQFEDREYFKDSGILHSFLKEKYLFWLEAMVLLRLVPQAVIAIQKLRDLVADSCTAGGGGCQTSLSPESWKVGIPGYFGWLFNAVTPMWKSEALLKKEANEMLELTRDVYRLVSAHRAVIEAFPLQIYASALIFSPSECILQKLFGATQCPEWIIVKPRLRQNWSNCIQIIEDHIYGVTSVATSPDNTMLATASRDCLAKIWDSTSGVCLYTIESLYSVEKVVFSPKSTQLALVTTEGVEIGDLITNSHRKIIDGRFVSVIFSADGSRLAIFGTNTIKFYDLATDSDLQTHTAQPGETFRAAMLSSNCAQLELALRDGTNRPRIRNSMLTDRAFHAMLVVSVRETSTLKVLDLATGECIQSIIADTDDGMHHNTVLLSSDGLRLATRSNTQDSISIWDLATGECLQTVGGHHLGEMVFSPDGMRLALGEGKDIKIWDVATGECLQILQGHADVVSSLAYSPDQLRLVSGGWDETARVWDLAADASPQLPESYSSDRDRIGSMTYSPNGRWLTSASADLTAVRIWNPATRVCLWALEMSDRVNVMVYSPDSMQLVTSEGNDGIIKFWDVATGACLRTLQGHTGAVLSIAFSPSGSQLASGSADGDLKIWDLTAEKCLHTFKIDYEVNSRIMFSPGGTQLGCVSQLGTIKIWDATTGACLQTLRKCLKPVLRASGPLTLFDNTGRDERLEKLLTCFSEEQQLVCAYETPGLELSRDRAWILRQQQPVIRIPPDYRNDVNDANKNSFAIASLSNELICFQFSLDKLDADINRQ